MGVLGEEIGICQTGIFQIFYLILFKIKFPDEIVDFKI